MTKDNRTPEMVRGSIKTLGSSAHTQEDRETNDYYATNPDDVIIFLDQIAADGVVLSDSIWEPACGEGHVSSVLLERGYDVLSSDIIDRGFDSAYQFDFIAPLFRHHLSSAWEDNIFDGDILTNPPFKHASTFIEQGLKRLKQGGKILLLLPLRYLETKERYYLFHKHPPKFIYVYSYRIKIGKSGNFSGSNAVAYAWYIWEKGNEADPIIKMIPHPKWRDADAE